MDSKTENEKLIGSCQKIPVQSPGFIQSIGGLLVLEGDAGVVVSMSDNLAEYLLEANENWLGTSIKDCAVDFYSLIEEIQSNSGEQPHYYFNYKNNEVRFVKNSNKLIIEFIKTDISAIHVEKVLGSEFYRIARSKNIDELHQTILQSLNHIIGYGHVMVYRFDDQWNGEVIAEWIDPEHSSDYSEYLNLSFPETDIPKQAREIYRKYWVRYTADVTTDPIPLQSHSNEAHDIGAAYIRGIASSHVRYLINMGIKATYSASIIVNGKLWGLLAAHNKTAKPLSFEVLNATEELAKLYSSILSIRLNDVTKNWVDQHKEQLLSYSTSMSKGQDPLNMSEQALSVLAKSLRAHGGVVWDQGVKQQWGETPESQWCEDALALLDESSFSSHVYATNHLIAFDKDLATADFAGVLVIGAPLAAGRAIFVFRKEEPQEKLWGGDPRLEAMTIDNGVLNPRNSFDAWKESLTGYSRPWLNEEVALAQAIAEKFIMAHVTLGTLESAQKSAKLNMLNMLLHDIGNALAGVSGEILQLQQVNADKSAVNNLERLIGFIKDNLTPISSVLGEKKGMALFDLIQQIHGTINSQFSEIEDSMHHMEVGLIHAKELLDLQKIYAQSSTSYGRECHLAEILNDAISVLRTSVESRGEIKITIPEKIPCLTVDRSKIMQVTMNLIKNAFEAWDALNEQKSGSNKVEKLIIELIVSIDEDNIQLQVIDNGIGLDQEQLNQIFNQPYSTKQRSSGIGLMNCKRLAKSSGAELLITSEGKGQGAVAIVNFPKEIWV